MSWYPDMGNETMVVSGEYVRAVGWLSSKRPFPTGETPEGFLEVLRTWCKACNACEELLAWPCFCGPHTCELCHDYMTIGNFGVPAGEVLYVVPEMIAHYVETHAYLPPEEFVAALLQAPLPGTPLYQSQIAPFRRVQDEFLELQRQEHERRRAVDAVRKQAREASYEKLLQEAARWASDLGGQPQVVSDAAHRFFGHRSPKLCERIEQEMRGRRAAPG